jgi:hypothetical protein
VDYALRLSVRRTTAVNATAGQGARFGIETGMVIMEMGYDEDVDHDLRDALADAAESDLVDEDTDEVVDAVLVWYREDDGDLVDLWSTRSSRSRKTGWCGC